jgi:hypothetical protein
VGSVTIKTMEFTAETLRTQRNQLISKTIQPDLKPLMPLVVVLPTIIHPHAPTDFLTFHFIYFPVFREFGGFRGH